MSTGGSSRAGIRRGPDRPRSRRALALAAALGLLVVFLGLQDNGRTPKAGARVSVPVAEAATDGRTGPAGREPAGRGPAGPAEVESGSTAARPEIATEPAPAPMAAMPLSASPDLLFDPSSLAEAAPRPPVDVPEMTLRADTIVPSEPVSGEPAGPRFSGEATTGAIDPAGVAAAGAPAEAAKARTPAPRLAGTWAADRSACSRRNSGFLPLVIDGKGARAGTASCRFGRTQQSGNRWAIAATCRSGQETWAANVKLVLDGTRLTWSSERGTEHYQRCR